jgi:hypothetical protein
VIRCYTVCPDLCTSKLHVLNVDEAAVGLVVGGGLGVPTQTRHSGFSWWRAGVGEFGGISRVSQVTRPGKQPRSLAKIA